MPHFIILGTKFICALVEAFNANELELVSYLMQIYLTANQVAETREDKPAEEAIQTANNFASDICDNHTTANRLTDAQTILTALQNLL